MAKTRDTTHLGVLPQAFALALLGTGVLCGVATVGHSLAHAAEAADGHGVDAARPTRVTDDIGRQVTLPPRPIRRVVSLAPSNTEILIALGAVNRIVGVDQYSAPLVPSATRLGTTLDPSLERLVSLKPDIVLVAQTANKPSTLDALTRMGIPVYVTITERATDLPRTLDGIGRVLGLGDQARSLARKVADELADVRKQSAALAKTSVLTIVWPNPLLVVGKDCFTDDLLTDAGGQNLGRSAGPGFPRYSLEQLMRLSPAAVVVGTHDGDARVLEASVRKLLSTPSLKAAKVQFVPGDLIFRPGPSLGKAARQLLSILHPELQANPRPAPASPSDNTRAGGGPWAAPSTAPGRAATNPDHHNGGKAP